MNNFNKIISFVLGLIVVIIILLVITGKFNIANFRNRLLTVSKGSSTTKPTPTAIARKTKPTPTRRYLADNTTQISESPNGVDTVTTIPNTGSSTTILAVAFIALLLGVYLMKMDSTTY